MWVWGLVSVGDVVYLVSVLGVEDGLTNVARVSTFGFVTCALAEWSVRVAPAEYAVVFTVARRSWACRVWGVQHSDHHIEMKALLG